jgi:hypothetical protein
MLVRDPRSRFQSVDELAEALKATRLASQIPSLPQVHESDACGSPLSISDAPTRADLNTIGREIVSPPEISTNPPAASFNQAKITPTSATQVSSTNRPGGGSRFVLGTLAAVGALGLGGLLATKSHPHLFHTQPPESSKNESRNQGDNSGLPISVPQ